MSALEWAAWLDRTDEAGVYLVDLENRHAIAEAARGLGYGLAGLDLEGCDSSEALFERMAGALRFPDWFGHNWDALADCLGDMGWWPAAGHLLLVEDGGAFRQGHRKLFNQLLDSLDEFAQPSRQARTTPLWTFVLLSPAQLERLDD